MAGNFGATILRKRWLARLPVGLFRAGLGFLFAGRLVLLEHVGRKSQERRFVVLEVVARPGKGEFIVASAVGSKAQWFQNLVANDHCHASIGFRRRFAAVATVLAPDEAALFLAIYQDAHPALWKQLDATMIDLHGGEKHYELPLVRVAMATKQTA